jgi:branched-chain amino acid transport system permease protein
MAAIGFAAFPLPARSLRHRRALGAGLAGILLANSRASSARDMMHWTKSGELIVMVVLGGMGTLLGPVLGAAALLRAGGGSAASLEHCQF